MKLEVWNTVTQKHIGRIKKNKNYMLGIAIVFKITILKKKKVEKMVEIRAFS